MNRPIGERARNSRADASTPRTTETGGKRERRILLSSLAIAAALVAAVLLASGCSSGKPPAAAARPSETTPHNVTLTAVQRQSIHTITVASSNYRTAITTTGTVDFDHDRAVSVLAPFSGAVTSVPVELGQFVTKGEVLAQVNSPDFTAAAGAYRKAVLAAKLARAVAANDRALAARQAISQRESAQAQEDAASAVTDRNAALQTLVALRVPPQTIADIRAGKLTAHGPALVRAPISGRIVAKSVAPGQTLAAGSSPCFIIANTSTMWVMAQVFSSDIPRINVGDPALVDPGDGSAPIHGVVTNVSSVVNPDTRSVDARVRVDNFSGALKAQMYVTVHIQSRNQRNGLLIPVSAVLRNSEDLPFVYIVTPNGSYARQPVTLGPRVGDLYVISQGLQPGEQVVVDGSIFLNFIQTQ